MVERYGLLSALTSPELSRFQVRLVCCLQHWENIQPAEAPAKKILTFHNKIVAEVHHLHCNLRADEQPSGVMLLS